VLDAVRQPVQVDAGIHSRIARFAEDSPRLKVEHIQPQTDRAVVGVQPFGQEGRRVRDRRPGAHYRSASPSAHLTSYGRGRRRATLLAEIG
jgi:hypothetical protein